MPLYLPLRTEEGRHSDLLIVGTKLDVGVSTSWLLEIVLQ